MTTQPDTSKPAREPSMPATPERVDRCTQARPARGLALLGGWLLALALALLPESAAALESRLATTGNQDESEQIAEALAAFPEPTRRAAFIVAGYPEDLLEIQTLQQRSADRFEKLIAPYPRADQEQIWNLVRYPDLAAELSRGGRKTQAELEAIAARYPSEDRAAIVREGLERAPLWVEIYALDLEARQGFSTQIATHPDDVRTAFEEVATRPELISLLTDNIHWTTVQGAEYRDNPGAVEKRYEALQAQVEFRRAEEERAWAEELQDPKAAAELEAAAKEFADSYDYDYADLEQAYADGYSAASRDGRSTRTFYVDRTVYVNPYPYWFGYPYWYDTAFWYPLSFSRHVGFRTGPRYRHGHAYVSVGLPSVLFLGWYHDIYRPRHRAAHFSNNTYKNRRSIRYWDSHRPKHWLRHTRRNAVRDGDRDGRRTPRVGLHEPRRREVQRDGRGVGIREERRTNPRERRIDRSGSNRRSGTEARPPKLRRRDTPLHAPKKQTTPGRSDSDANRARPNPPIRAGVRPDARSERANRRDTSERQRQTRREVRRERSTSTSSNERVDRTRPARDQARIQDTLRQQKARVARADAPSERRVRQASSSDTRRAPKNVRPQRRERRASASDSSARLHSPKQKSKNRPSVQKSNTRSGSKGNRSAQKGRSNRGSRR